MSLAEGNGPVGVVVGVPPDVLPKLPPPAPLPPPAAGVALAKSVPERLDDAREPLLSESAAQPTMPSEAASATP
jgi:hypothetical protein